MWNEVNNTAHQSLRGHLRIKSLWGQNHSVFTQWPESDPPEINGWEWLILYHISAPFSGLQTVTVCVEAYSAMIRAGYAGTLLGFFWFVCFSRGLFSLANAWQRLNRALLSLACRGRVTEQLNEDEGSGAKGQQHTNTREDGTGKIRGRKQRAEQPRGNFI